MLSSARLSIPWLSGDAAGQSALSAARPPVATNVNADRPPAIIRRLDVIASAPPPKTDFQSMSAKSNIAAAVHSHVDRCRAGRGAYWQTAWPRNPFDHVEGLRSPIREARRQSGGSDQRGGVSARQNVIWGQIGGTRQEWSRYGLIRDWLSDRFQCHSTNDYRIARSILTRAPTRCASPTRMPPATSTTWRSAPISRPRASPSCATWG